MARSKAQRLVESLCKVCRALPGTTEDVKWEHHLVFSVGGRMYAIFETSGELPLSMKASPGAFEQLSAQEGVIPAPYLARAQWIQVREADALPRQMLVELIEESHALIAAKLSKRRREQLGIE